jgi:hypothetical protein
MISRPAVIRINIVCPACGAENLIRFEDSEMLRELPCSHCSAIVWWKRRPYPKGVGVCCAFDDYETEIAPDRQ